MPQNQVPCWALSRGLGREGSEQAGLLPALGVWAVCFQKTKHHLCPGGQLAGWSLSSGLALAVERVASFHIEDLVDGMVEGNVEVKALGQGKFVSGAAVSATASTSVNVCMLKVPLNTWGAMKKER